jgi:hypothetical protein
MQKKVFVAENNIELWELKETKTDTDGKTFDVWVLVKSYGKDVAEEELKSIDAKIEELNPTKMGDRITALEETKATVLNIKTILDNGTKTEANIGVDG